MEYQKALFGENVLEPCTERSVQELLIDIDPYLWAAVVNSFDNFIQRRSEDAAFRILTAGEAAQWLRPQIIDRAKRIFELQDAMRFFERRQQKFFVYKDQIVICFKKLTQRKVSATQTRLERSNYLTRQNRDYWQQRMIDGFPDLPRIIVGYEFLRELTDVRVLVCYPRSRSRALKWVYQMPDQNQALIRIEEESREESVVDDQEKRGFIVHARTNLRKGMSDER